MTSIVPALFAAFEAQGLEVRFESSDGGTADPDAQFARAWRQDGTALHTGAGLALAEVRLLEEVLAGQRGHCLIVGNGFGWSAVALALILRGRGRVVAIDACLEGDDGAFGIDITNVMARGHGLELEAVRGVSPIDVPGVVAGYLGGRLDIVLIDSLHTDQQQSADYAAVKPFCHADTLVLFHDVLNWQMTDSFSAIAAEDGREALLLDRTPSGMGALFPSGAPYTTLLQASAGDARRARTLGSTWHQRYLDVSRTYLATGDHDTGLEYFERALVLTQAPAETWTRRAWQTISVDRWDDCAHAVAMARAHGADSPALAHLGALAARAGGASHQEVWSMLAPHLSAPDSSPEMLADAAAAAIGLGHTERGAETAARAATLRPSWALPHYLGAIAAQQRGASADEVAARLAAVLARDGVTPALQLDVACAMLTAGDNAGAADLAERVARSQPQWARPWHVRGLAARAAGASPDEVAHWLEMALARPPVSGELACDVGFLAWQRGDVARALAMARHATDVRPELAPAWYLGGLCRRAAGAAPGDVARDWARAMSLGFATPELWVDAGFVALELEDLAEAERLAHLATNQRPDWSVPLHLLALIARAKGEGPGGEAPFLRRAVALPPISAELAYDVAQLSLWRGERAEAERLATQAAALRPEWTAPVELVARIRDERERVCPG